MAEINDRIESLLFKGSSAQRIALCKDNPLYFAVYYFPEYFVYKVPPFHLDFYQDIEDLDRGVLNEAVWDAFRESAKTSIAKIALACWAICYKKFGGYINWDSFDKSNSEAALFDITVALQSNKRLIRDFGQLYYKKMTNEAMSEAKMKRISSFVTENDVKVEGFSTQESTRGRLYKNRRPGLFILEDFEISKTKDSYPITHKVISHIEEMRAGLGEVSAVLYLCNYITEDGSVAHVETAVKRNAKGRVRRIPIINADGAIAWPDKYVYTEAEAVELNQGVTDPKRRKISLQALEQRLGKSVYETEMKLNPAAGGDKVFDREIVEQLLKAAKPPTREIAGLKLWKDYDPSHRYAIGADTAKGVGRDSNALAIIDFSTIPNRVIATYKNNLMAPDIFAYEIQRAGDMYGQPLAAPENNNTGYATITQLKKIYPINQIFVPLKEEKITNKLSDEYGWDTNSSTKPEMIYQLKRAIEDGLLVSYDKDFLEELKHYGQKDLNTMKLVEGMTRHFDLTMSVAIAWMMRTHAKLSPTQKKKVKQADHVPAAGEYGG